jgi:hypothetical protein
LAAQTGGCFASRELITRDIVSLISFEYNFQRAFDVAGTIGEHCESSVFNGLADMSTELILERAQGIEPKLLMVARDGIEPLTPVFSGPPTNGPKWLIISGRD